MSEGIKIIRTPIFRVSYPSVFQKDKYKRYSLTAVCNPDEMNSKNIAALDNVIKIAEKIGTDFHKKPVKLLRKNPNFKWPFRDGIEREGTDGYGEGITFFSMSNNKKKPQVVNRERELIYEEDEFYAGCYAIASISIFGYKNEGQGVGIGLHNVWKVKEGKPFSFSTTADKDFGDISEDLLPEDDYVSDDEDDDDLL